MFFQFFLRSFLFLPGLKSGHTHTQTNKQTNKQTHRLGRISPLKISDSKRPKTCTSWEFFTHHLNIIMLSLVKSSMKSRTLFGSFKSETNRSVIVKRSFSSPASPSSDAYSLGVQILHWMMGVTFHQHFHYDIEI